MSTSMRRRVGLLTLGTSAVKSAQIVIALLLVHLVQPEAWNEVALALSIHLAGLTIASLNLQQSLVFLLPQLPVGQQRAAVARTAHVLSLVGAAVAAMLVLAAVTGGGLGALDPPGVALVAVALALELPTVCAPAVFVSTDRLGRGAVWDVATTVLQVVSMAVPAAAGHGAVGVLVGLVASSAVRRLAFGAVVAALPQGEAPDPRFLARQLIYCAPLGLTLATGALTRAADKWIVAWLEPGSVGVYAIAAQELPVLAVLPYAGGAAIVLDLVRHFAGDAPTAAHRLWWQQAAVMSGAVVPITLFLVVAAPELWALLFPASYSSGVFAFRCFALIGVHRITEYGVVLRAANRMATLVRLSVLLLLLNALFAVAGGLVWGGDGVAAGCLVAHLGSWLATVAVLGRVFGVPYRAAFPWRAWAQWLGVGTVAAVTAATATASMPTMGGLGALPKLAAKAATFAAVVLGLRRVTRLAPRQIAVAT